jgi:hydrogenase expression/formation protein HypE
MLGKVSPADLTEHVFGKTGASLDSVLQGPAYGEDAAAIEVESGTLVVSSDPISLAIDQVGTLGIYVACNDIAASGGDPTWLESVIFLPGSDDPEAALDRITDQMDEAARNLGVSIVGGHSEYNPALERPLLTLTCMGMADPFVPTGGADPGDEVVLTKGAAIEGTAILASDFADQLREQGIDDALLAEATGYYDEIGVMTEAEIIRSHASAMHDPTEGGLIDGLLELATASGVALDIDAAAIPVREPTRRLCDLMEVDPFRIFGSGALLATVPTEALDPIRTALAEEDIEMAHIGSVQAADTPSLRLGGTEYREPVRDDLYRLWE